MLANMHCFFKNIGFVFYQYLPLTNQKSDKLSKYYKNTPRSLSQYQDAFKRSKISKNIKNFCIYKNFYKMVIDINVVTIFIIFVKCKNIN